MTFAMQAPGLDGSPSSVRAARSAEVRLRLTAAVDRLDAVEVVVGALACDTAWQSRGIAALHGRLEEVRGEVAGATAAVRGSSPCSPRERRAGGGGRPEGLGGGRDGRRGGLWKG